MWLFGEVLKKGQTAFEGHHTLINREKLCRSVAVFEAGQEKVEEWSDLEELVKAWFSPLRLCLRVIEVEKSHYEFKPAA